MYTQSDLDSRRRCGKYSAVNTGPRSTATPMGLRLCVCWRNERVRGTRRAHPGGVRYHPGPRDCGEECSSLSIPYKERNRAVTHMAVPDCRPAALPVVWTLVAPARPEAVQGARGRETRAGRVAWLCSVRRRPSRSIPRRGDAIMGLFPGVSRRSGRSGPRDEPGSPGAGS